LKWLRNTLESLKALAEEEKRFERGITLYRELRKVETEVRLFGSPVTSADRIEELKREVRSFYTEFTQWMKSRV